MNTFFSFRGGRRLAAMLVLMAGPLAAQLPQGVTKGATVEGITEYDLSNGLRVLIFPDASKPTATINITYLVGSRHEGYGETGMAHLLEHMNFKGTPKHPDIPAELTARGARNNASTFFDRTNYFETIPASDSNVTWALGSRGGPDAPQQHRQEGPRERNDRRAQRVRNGGELAVPNPL